MLKTSSIHNTLVVMMIQIWALRVTILMPTSSGTTAVCTTKTLLEHRFLIKWLWMQKHYHQPWQMNSLKAKTIWAASTIQDKDIPWLAPRKMRCKSLNKTISKEQRMRTSSSNKKWLSSHLSIRKCSITASTNKDKFTIPLRPSTIQRMKMKDKVWLSIWTQKMKAAQVQWSCHRYNLNRVKVNLQINKKVDRAYKRHRNNNKSYNKNKLNRKWTMIIGMIIKMIKD